MLWMWVSMTGHTGKTGVIQQLYHLLTYYHWLNIFRHLWKYFSRVQKLFLLMIKACSSPTSERHQSALDAVGARYSTSTSQCFKIIKCLAFFKTFQCINQSKLTHQWSALYINIKSHYKQHQSWSTHSADPFKIITFSERIWVEHLFFVCSHRKMEMNPKAYPNIYHVWINPKVHIKRDTLQKLPARHINLLRRKKEIFSWKQTLSVRRINNSAFHTGTFFSVQ